MGGSNGKLNMKQPPRMKSEAEVANTETPKGGIFRLIDPRSPLTEVNRTPIAVPKSKLDVSDDLSGMDATVSPPADLTATPSAEMTHLKSKQIDDASDTEDAPDTKNASDTEDAPGTNDASDTEDAPDTNDESDTEDAPGVDDASDIEDAPDTKDESDIEDTPGANDASDTEDTPNTDGVPDTDDMTVTDPVATPLVEVPPAKLEEVDDSDASSTDDVKKNRETDNLPNIKKCTLK